MSTNKISDMAEEILATVDAEYGGEDEAIFELAKAQIHMGWSAEDVSDLLAELGF